MNSYSHTHILFSLIKVAISGNTTYWSHTNHIEWDEVYKLAVRQGVAAIVWDGVQLLTHSAILNQEQLPPRSLKLQWALGTENIERRYNKQLKTAMELSDNFRAHNIATIVLKGFAISRYYPVPEHRECGDLDCFLISIDKTRNQSIAINGGLPVCRYDDGNTIAQNIGAKVEVGFYKHSHINYKGLMVENHAFCTAIRGSRDRKALERHLQNLIAVNTNKQIDNTTLLSPCASFNALFLTAHSFGHFLTEGIKLRHVLDWALLLKTEQHNIDWQSFYEWCDRMGYTRFVDVITAISTDITDLEITNSAIRSDRTLYDKTVNDILFDAKSIHNTNASKLKKRMMVLRALLFDSWKYKEIYHRSALWDTTKTLLAYIFERNPKL